jgi:hypothetical protein
VLRHKKIISFIAVLAIILSQFSAQVHATDHPFHQEDVLCVSLQSAEHGQHFFQAAAYSHTGNALVIVTGVTHAGRISPFLNPYYSSRAPPEPAA